MRAGQEVVDSDYLFVNAKREILKSQMSYDPLLPVITRVASGYWL